MYLQGVNLVSVLVGVAAVFIIGALWYSVLFGKPWKAVAEATNAKRFPDAVVYGLTLLINIVTAFVFGLVFAGFIASGWALAIGSLVGLVFAGFSLAIHYLGTGRKLQLLLIDGGFQVVRFSLFGLAFQIFR